MDARWHPTERGMQLQGAVLGMDNTVVVKNYWLSGFSVGTLYEYSMIGLGDSPAEPKRSAECGVVSARRFPYEIRIAGYTSSKPVSGLKRIR